ncbi:MAG: hypothetical protein KKF44_09255 [Nanoarchaeota archaeon]|nr:hypothetical protein [Nanoarchaeota archaeon]
MDPNLLDIVRGIIEFGSDTIKFVTSPEGVALSVGLAEAGTAAIIENRREQREANIFPVLYASDSDLLSDQKSDATDYYVAVNDLTMAVTEAWNDYRKDRKLDFAELLKSKKVLSYASRVQAYGERLQQNIENYSDLAERLNHVSTLFDESWKYEMYDRYRTEVDVDNSDTDGDGKPNITVTTKEVYTHTDHYFTFKREISEQAQELLISILEDFNVENIIYNPLLEELSARPTTQQKRSIAATILENIEAEVTDEKAILYVNEWLQKARINDANAVVNGLAEMDRKTQSYFKTINDSDDETYSYTTYEEGETISGPDGCGLSMYFKNTSNSLYENASGIMGSVQLGINTAEQITQLTEGKLHMKKIKNKKRAKEALDFAVESYLSNFPESEIDIDQRVDVGSILGTAGAIGAASGILTYLFHPQGIGLYQKALELFN